MKQSKVEVIAIYPKRMDVKGYRKCCAPKETFEMEFSTGSTESFDERNIYHYRVTFSFLRDGIKDTKNPFDLVYLVNSDGIEYPFDKESFYENFVKCIRKVY
jgi:hypothetical protein